MAKQQSNKHGSGKSEHVCTHPYRTLRQKNALKMHEANLATLTQQMLEQEIDNKAKIERIKFDINILKSKLDGSYNAKRKERREKEGRSTGVEKGSIVIGTIYIYRLQSGKYEGGQAAKKGSKRESVKMKRTKYKKVEVGTRTWKAGDGQLEKMRKGHSEFVPVKNYVFRGVRDGI